MRPAITLFLSGAVVAVTACAPQLLPPEADVLGMAAAGPAGAEPPAAADGPLKPGRLSESFSVSGSLGAGGSYQLYELGGSAAGDLWSVSAADLFAAPAPMVVVLFDADYNLLARRVVTTSSPLQHLMRAESARVYLGVTLPGGGQGGAFRYAVTRSGGHPVPAPRVQLVWLNFAAASGVRVHNRSGISFAAFDAAMLGQAYAGQTELVKRAIVAAMQTDYRRYGVVLLSSDDGPPPQGEYSTIHFGGQDPGLLGLADNVDGYNQDASQNAVIFVETFARFVTMGLTPEEMALMVANVASHELGHLLGLYHTRDPDDLMDTTGSAWELAEDQLFTRTELEPSVFPLGQEDSPRLLEQTVGLRPEAEPLDRPSAAAKMARRAKIRRLAREQLRWMCGTCQHLDDY